MRDGDGCVGLRVPRRTTGSARTSVEPFIGMGLGFGFRLGRVRLGPRGDFVSNERPRTAQLPREWVGGEGGGGGGARGGPGGGGGPAGGPRGGGGPGGGGGGGGGGRHPLGVPQNCCGTR